VTIVYAAATADLDPTTLYRILRLRSEVFVVEQACVYLDLDGRDLESTAAQLWIEQGDDVIATLRLLRDADGVHRIGRVATAGHARGRGLAAELMRAALERTGERAVVLNAQSYLAEWYARFGFRQDGEEFLDDGIPHVPMRRPGSRATRPPNSAS
jgi:ElaA protein